MRNHAGRTAAAVCALLATGAAGAQQLVEEPFEDSALTEAQRNAWDYYLAEESAQYGCRYGDDQRLKDNPREVLERLADDADIEPVQVTLRTFLFAGENVQELLSRNMVIASMECNPVYYYDGELIGHPVLPFEEFVDIVLRRMDNGVPLGEQIDFLRGTKPAAMDVRWFWAFFVLDADHHRMLGHDYEDVAELVEAFPGTPETETPAGAYWAIYDAAFSQGLYVASSNDCDGTHAEPSEEVIIDKNIEWETVAALYAYENIPYSGSWDPSIEREEEGYTLAETSAIEDPTNPTSTSNAA